MEKIILYILKKINESSIEELKDIKVEESKTGKINMKMENGQKIYVIPKEYFYMITQAVEEEKVRRVYNEKRKNMLFEEENREMFEMLDDRQMKNKVEENKEIHSSTRKKRNIKNKPQRMKKIKRFIPVLKKGLRVLVALGLATTAVLGGVKATSDVAKDINDYKNVEASVEGWSEEQIGKEAESELKEMISEATKVNEDEISFSDEWETPSTNLSTYTVKVKAGEKEYNHISERRDLFRFNNNSTLSGKIADLISKMKNAEGREDAIKALKDIKNFSDTYELKVEDNKLIEEEEVR